MKNRLLLLACFFFCSTLSAQLKYFSPEAMNGYTLFQGAELYLVNNCGEVVHTWDGNFVPKYHVKLLPNGNIIYIDWMENTVVEKDWDDNIVNEVSPLDDDIRLDYEVIVLENGNYLCVARKDVDNLYFASIGYDNDSLPTPFDIDIVIEMDSETGETLWLWNAGDHVIQERSDTIPNYGVLSDHPELLNLDGIALNDWWEEMYMINGMDYNATLDQIVLSLRKSGEIIIIDHSTTTAEAAGHTGGNSGKGGDILYRWGNPKNYNRGTTDDQQLYFHHNPNWVEYGEHVGKIAIYNNGLYRPGIFNPQDQYSDAPMIETSIQSDGSYSIDPLLPFESSTPAVIYGLPGSANNFYSQFTSATKVLQNGNVLITVGDDNRVIELKPDGTMVWEYDLVTAGFTFRVEKYPLDYSAFVGRDLTPSSTIENPSSTIPCDLTSSLEDISNPSIKVWVDDSSRELFIKGEIGADYDIAIFDLLGRKLKTYFVKDSGNDLNKFQVPQNINGVIILTLIDKKSGDQISTKLVLR